MPKKSNYFGFCSFGSASCFRLVPLLQRHVADNTQPIQPATVAAHQHAVSSIVSDN